MIIMATAINPGGSGGKGGNAITKGGITEHKLITNLGCVSGDKSLFRRWHRKFMTTLGQYDQYDQHLVKDADLGKNLNKVVEDLKLTYGGAFGRV